MDAINRGLAQLADNPIVQVVIAVIFFVIRLELDRRDRRRAARRHEPKKAKANG